MTIRKALGFNGVDNYVNVPDADDYVDCGTDASLDLSALTVEAWVKPSSLQLGAIVDMGQEGTEIENYGVLISGSTLYFQWNNAGWRQVNDPNYWVVDIWHHVAVIYNNGEVKIYKNAVETVSSAGQAALVTNIANVLKMGRYQVGSQGLFNGVIDEVRISDVARTAEEILANWNNGKGKKLEADAHTVALWHIDEGEGDTIFDETENHNDGTIYGATWLDNEGVPFP